MGMSTFIIGFRPPDKRWKEMKKIWDSCDKANIEQPKEVDEFFDGEEPDASGVKIELEGTEAVQDYDEENGSGFQVDISKLPKDLKLIRFYNNW